MNEVHDFLGKEIVAGCWIVYPVRKGSKLWMSKARVQKVEKVDDQATLYAVRGDGRQVEITKISNCVVVEL